MVWNFSPLKTSTLVSGFGILAGFAFCLYFSHIYVRPCCYCMGSSVVPLLHYNDHPQEVDAKEDTKEMTEFSS